MFVTLFVFEMSREELEGFILSNPKRRQIVNALDKSEGLSLEGIAKKKRIPEQLLKKLLDELVKKEVLIEEDDVYQLSEVGEEIVASSHRFESG